MEDTIVSFEVAKLAKDKGFTDLVGVFRGKHYYNHNGELDGDQKDYLKAYVRQEDTSLMESIAAPTQSLLQKWLREVHSIHVNIKHRPHSQSYCFTITGKYQGINEGELVNNIFSKYETYELALEVALQESLQLI